MTNRLVGRAIKPVGNQEVSRAREGERKGGGRGGHARDGGQNKCWNADGRQQTLLRGEETGCPFHTAPALALATAALMAAACTPYAAIGSVYPAPAVP